MVLHFFSDMLADKILEQQASGTHAVIICASFSLPFFMYLSTSIFWSRDYVLLSLVCIPEPDILIDTQKYHDGYFGMNK